MQVPDSANSLAQADSALSCLLANAGMRPGKALALTWRRIGERSISVTKAVALGEVGETKTRPDRVVPLLGPLRDDLDELRQPRARPVEVPDANDAPIAARR